MPRIVEVETNIGTAYATVPHAVPKENIVDIQVRTETGMKIVKLVVGRKDAIARIIDYVFDHRERKDITCKNRFQVNTVFRIV